VQILMGILALEGGIYQSISPREILVVNNIHFKNERLICIYLIYSGAVACGLLGVSSVSGGCEGVSGAGDDAVFSS
jgi:hypothetical protein